MTAKALKTNIFEWEGKDSSGKKTKGVIDAPTPAIVKAQLRRKGIIPLKVKKQARPLFGGGGEKKITTADITVFARQLTAMMEAGVPLVQAFGIVAQGQENKSMQELIFQIKADVESGSNLSVALRKHPEQFDDLFCNLVEAGEQSGTLDSLLNEIATYKEKTESLKRKIKKAMTYPIAVLVVAFVVTAILLIFVVPQFESLFQGMGSDLPAFTRMVVNLSEAFQAWWYVIFGGIGLLVYTFIYLKKHSEKFAYGLDKLTLRLPLFGDIVTKAATARFARTLATMSKAGVPLVEALESVSGTSGNAIFKEAILKIRDETETGQQLQISMRQSGMFSNMVIQMVAIGEEAGSLEDMLSKVADYYEEEVDAAVDAMTSMMEPMIMSFLGIVIGGLVIAMYLPIFKMGDAF